jgi:hypothetical protein
MRVGTGSQSAPAFSLAELFLSPADLSPTLSLLWRPAVVDGEISK